jgi:hypothetical protein
MLTLMKTMEREIRFHSGNVSNFSTEITTYFNHAGIDNTMVYLYIYRDRNMQYTNYIPVLNGLKVFSMMRGVFLKVRTGGYCYS